MGYKIDDRVVHPTYGVGRIVGLVKKRFEAEEQQYYEVAIERSTVWVPLACTGTHTVLRSMATS